MADFPRLQQQFAGNVQAYPAMLEVLAADLGVSPDSLSRLGVGYAPVVAFKKGKNSPGWWATPERDAHGTVTGLSLRGVSDGSRKPMIPGSKHGLFYPVRPDFDSGVDPYEPGPHNWVRTRDAGLDCPLCDKPDGCLLAADDPEDPKAVICCRVRDGAHRPMDLGFLHILKPEGHVAPNNPLPSSSLPIVIVEGMSDTAAALDLGFVAIGRPSALSTKGLPALCKGRRVIIVGENDTPDKWGRQVGLDGMKAAAAVLGPVCPEVLQVLPPGDAKDLRQWRWNHNITAEELIEYARGHGVVPDDSNTLASGDPQPVARQWLRDEYWDRQRDMTTLARYRGIFYQHDGVSYQEHDTDALRGKLYTWLDGKQYLVGDDKDTTKPYAPNTARVNNIIDALVGECVVENDPPCWLSGEQVDPRDMVVFRNGILRVDRYLTDEEHYLTPLTPAFFSLHALPYDFDPDASCDSWHRYLHSTFGGDWEKIDLLQEWFGLCMVADMRYEKMLLLYGRSGSGKGTALEAFSALLGEHQIASTKMASIAESFGIEPLQGKLAAIMSDVRLTRSTDATQALENLLRITGGDAVDVPRKHRQNLSNVQLQTRFILAANELPELPDHSQALVRRLLILPFETSFVGREDTGLKDRLREEAPGIAVWALEGLRRLRQNGKFTEPASAHKLFEDFRQVTSPVAEFAEDCLIMDETGVVGYLELFDLWSAWADARGMRPGHRTRFEQRLLAAFPDLQVETQVHNQQKFKRFKGVELDAAAIRRYT